MEQQLLNFLSSDDTLRNQTLNQVEQQCTTRPDDYAQSLCALLTTSTPATDPQLEVQRLQLREIASLVLHKNLLSNDDNFPRISQATLARISESVFAMVDASAESMNWGLLKRSSEILVEIAIKCDQVGPLFGQIKTFQLNVFAARSGQKGFVKLAKFGFYSLELLCEYRADEPAIQQAAGDFLAIFSAGFSCDNHEIKSFSTAAVCVFFLSQVKEGLSNDFHVVLDALVDVLIDTIKSKRGAL